MSIWLSLRGRLIRRWVRWRDRQQARKSIGHLLKRSDDHLLEDIGLTRQDLRNLLERWDDCACEGRLAQIVSRTAPGVCPCT